VPISGIRLSDWLHRRLTNEAQLHPTKPENPQLAEYHFIAEAAGAARWRLVASLFALR